MVKLLTEMRIKKYINEDIWGPASDSLGKDACHTSLIMRVQFPDATVRGENPFLKVVF